MCEGLPEQIPENGVREMRSKSPEIPYPISDKFFIFVPNIPLPRI